MVRLTIGPRLDNINKNPLSTPRHLPPPLPLQLHGNVVIMAIFGIQYFGRLSTPYFGPADFAKPGLEEKFVYHNL